MKPELQFHFNIQWVYCIGDEGMLGGGGGGVILRVAEFPPPLLTDKVIFLCVTIFLLGLYFLQADKHVLTSGERDGVLSQPEGGPSRFSSQKLHVSIHVFKYIPV